MGILEFIKLFGGIALFLYGMIIMSASLEKMAGGRLEHILKRATSSRLKGLALGLGITCAIQSSSAVTVMLVGLVNSGIMRLHQTVGVIMGTNIGTTITAWLLSSIGIQTDNTILKLLKPESVAPLMAVAGIVMVMAFKAEKRRNIGAILLGFSVLMFGMTVMSESVAGLENDTGFANILTAFKNPFLGVLAGAVFTGIIQSSSASVGLLQSFAATIGIQYATAVPIIMGQNIGTCVTALLSTIGANKNAKRVAVIHIYFNVIGTICYIIIIYGLNAIFRFSFLSDNITPLGIAVVHSLFNITVTAVLFPFGNYLEKLSMLTVRENKSEMQTYAFLDERLLNTPGLALAQCRDLAIKMCGIAHDAVLYSLSLFNSFDEKIAKRLRDNEQTLDSYEDRLGTYLVKLSSRELPDADSWEVSRLLHAISDLERMGDHGLNLLESAEEMNNKDITFSRSALDDLSVVESALREVIGMTLHAFTNRDLDSARQIEPMEQVVDELVHSARARHIKRLQNGECAIETSFVWSDIMVNFERISDHCSNLALSLIQSNKQSMTGHLYMAELKSKDNSEFMALFETFRGKYPFKKI
ncbi:MAG: Na/Pi cotransporter family protein [Clostridiales bacterium]|jgi:phosphate:Na+ symporter|nr:Na/Pi cotransporter family protein [Clostridiales bacterium]